MNVRAFTDGTVMDGRSGWAYILIDGKENVIHQANGILEGEINQMRQIGGEMKGVLEAVSFCKKNNHTVEIYHDYIGLYAWVQDFFDWTKKPWKRNNIWAEQYREYIKKNQQYIDGFQWVRGHQKQNSSIYAKWNNAVDKLTRAAFDK